VEAEPSLHNCNKTGHFARECPYPKKNNNQNQGGPRQANARAGHVHYTAVEEILAGEVVTAGMFRVNHHPAIILFDSGASHSFMSQTFASKHGQKTTMVNQGGYCISSARASISTNQIVRKVTISLNEREYTLDLIVLPGLEIDVILGMKWMSSYGVTIDTEGRTIKLREPKGEGTFLLPLPRSFDLQNLSCGIQTTTLYDIPVVHEFLDVFPDELPGLPLDRDVEFRIELVPGIAPISRRPYRMPPNELAELKIQIQELLDKGLI